MQHTVEVIGLGAGEIDQLPLGIYKKLKQKEMPIYVRTIDHPVIKTLQNEGVAINAFDHFYVASNNFDIVYEKIVNTLIKKAKNQSIIYAVPGHPMLAEKTVQLLLDQKEVEVQIGGGQSYLDDLFTALQLDPIHGFQFVDATSFSRDELNYQTPIIFCQVYDSFVASEVKLTLLEDLPPEHTIVIAEAVGT